MPWRVLVVAALIASLFGPWSALPARAQACTFVLGFATLHNLIPQILGDCIDNETHNPANGDGLQATTNGLLVWRKSDNFTAFTNGFRSWVNGPFGLQTRLNTQRFFWEQNPAGLPIIPTPVAGDRCHTAGLSLSLVNEEGAAGSVVATFRFANNLTVPCTFFGFVGAQRLDDQNNPLPTNVVRGGGFLSNQPGPALVTVPAKGTATFLMHWGQVEVGTEVCLTSSQLAVTPPDEFDPLIIPIQIRACAGGTLNVSAVAPTATLSRNWSGYAASGGVFTAVTGTWNVPESRGTSSAAGATWVGIGGLEGSDLIQAGTDYINDGLGNVQYDAWMETLPLPPVIVPLAVSPGDSVTVSISRQGTVRWTISMKNNTTGQTYQTTLAYESSLSSAEWIHEAASTRRRLLPPGDFETVQFTSGSTIKDGKTLTIAHAGAQPITMVDFGGNVLATASGLAPGGSGFSIDRASS